AWVDEDGRSVTESQLAILRAVECNAQTPVLPRRPDDHALVEMGVRQMVKEEKTAGGELGRPSGARLRVYEQLKDYSKRVQGMLVCTLDLAKAIDQIYRYPLQQSAADALNRQLKIGIRDIDLANFVVSLWEQDRLCRVEEEAESQEPQIICSLGLSTGQE